MQTYRIALVTAPSARRLDEDLALLDTALRIAGAEVEIVDWDDATTDWSAFDLAVLRSAWDYPKRLQEFLAWTEHVAARTTLLNPASVIRWNTDKHYLAELNHAGVPTVPSHFIEPGEEATTGMQRFFALHPGVAELVVKPTVGAGSRDARRFLRADIVAATGHAQLLLDGRRSVLLQPYFERVDDEGETSLVYMSGTFSHAVRRGAVLRRSEPAIRALFNDKNISLTEPADDEIRVGAHVLATQPFGALLYARVDLIRNSGGMPCVLEVELTEPSMFLPLAPGAADRFAAAILDAAWKSGR
jgi:O-ureido-D-serine cyclo-ligase